MEGYSRLLDQHDLPRYISFFIDSSQPTDLESTH
jgi:hypothetical protein